MRYFIGYRLTYFYSELDPNHDIVTWTKLPGQPNHVPNQIMSTLQAGRRGCFVVRFSNDGRFVANVSCWYQFLSHFNKKMFVRKDFSIILG